MLIDSYIRSQKLRRAFVHLSLSLGLLVGLFALGALIDSRSAKDFQRSIEAVFRNDQTMGNTALLSRRLADLETLGIVSCLSVHTPELEEIYSTKFKDGCEAVKLFNRYRWSESTLRSLGGDAYKVNFKVTPSFGYTLTFASIILLALITLNGAVLFYWIRIDAKTHEVAFHQSLADIAAQVSHDIRSPLSALNVAVTTLTDIPDNKRDLILQVSSRIQAVADDLLKKYRDDSNHVPTLQVSLRKILENVYAEKTLQFRDKPDIKLELDIPKSDDALVGMDVQLLSRVLSNLINNAVESIVGAGRVVVALRLYGDQKASITIMDNGTGIPADILQRLGRQKVMTTKSTGESGNGLGVFHAKSAVQQSGGNLTFQSKLGSGTIVTISLPTGKVSQN